MGQAARWMAHPGEWILEVPVDGERAWRSSIRDIRMRRDIDISNIKLYPEFWWERLLRYGFIEWDSKARYGMTPRASAFVSGAIDAGAIRETIGRMCDCLQGARPPGHGSATAGCTNSKGNSPYLVKNRRGKSNE